MTDNLSVAGTAVSPRRLLVPLALAQFICSFAGSNMNVMINDISRDLDTTVQGVQTAITLFLLVMAALMIPGSKLSDRWGRKRCFTVGLAVYGVGALLSAVAPGLGVLVLGNSLLEGVGSALLIPPVYILTTLLFTDLTSRAWAFGRISGMGGVGAATGPLIGGLITTAVSWRAAFLFQTAVIVVIVLLSRKLVDPLPADPTRPFDTVGAVLSAVGMLLVVVGILQAGDNRPLMVVLLALGPASCAGSSSTSGPGSGPGRNRCCPPGCSATAPPTSAWSPRTSSGCCCWGPPSWSRSSSRPFAATTPSRPASSSPRRPSASWSPPWGPSGSPAGAPKRALILAGFVATIAGIGLLIGLVVASDTVLAFVPGLLLIGLGVGVMLTPSVNVVQSAFPEDQQGEISGLSRSVSNLGSSLGTAIAGTILVSDLASGNRSYALAMASLAVVGLIGLGAALLLPSSPVPQQA